MLLAFNILLNRQMIALFMLAFVMIIHLYATKEAFPSSGDWIESEMGLFGDLALFLAGLNQLTDGLKMAAGDALIVPM